MKMKMKEPSRYFNALIVWTSWLRYKLDPIGMENPDADMPVMVPGVCYAVWGMGAEDLECKAGISLSRVKGLVSNFF